MEEPRNRPLPESYWVEPGRFLAGEYPGRFDEEQTRRQIDALLEAGIDIFIDLTQPNEVLPYKRTLSEEANLYNIEVTCHRFAIGDFGLPTPAQMKSILDTIDEHLQAGRNIYLHCWGGIGRTGTAVGCYLVRRGRSAQEALDQLAEWWKTVPKSHIHPSSPETQAQVDFIRQWAGHERNL
jgi:predicted protein tyrosine phosphatase